MSVTDNTDGITEAVEEDQYVIEYFFTTNYPYRWGNGPIVTTLNTETWEPISSLDEAKEMAAKKRVISDGEDRCDTTFGMQYKLLPKPYKPNMT